MNPAVNKREEMRPVVQATFLHSLEHFHSQPCVINVPNLQLVEHGLNNGSNDGSHHIYSQEIWTEMNHDGDGVLNQIPVPTLVLASEWPSICLTKLLGLRRLGFHICPTQCQGRVCLLLRDVWNRVMHPLRLLLSLEHLTSTPTKNAVKCAFDTDGDMDLLFSRHHLHCRELWMSLEKEITCTVRNSNEMMAKTRELTYVLSTYPIPISLVMFSETTFPNQPRRSTSHSIFQSR